MSALDLSAAVEAAARHFYEDYESEGGKRADHDTWDALLDRASGAKPRGFMDAEIRDDYRRAARAAVTAAAPIIEAAVREQIARVIDAEVAAAREVYTLSGAEGMAGRVLGLHRAARIARGAR